MSQKVLRRMLLFLSCVIFVLFYGVYLSSSLLSLSVLYHMSKHVSAPALTSRSSYDMLICVTVDLIRFLLVSFD